MVLSSTAKEGGAITKTLVYMTNPATGERECYRTTATPEEVQQHIDEVFSPAGYYDFEIKQEVQHEHERTGSQGCRTAGAAAHG